MLIEPGAMSFAAARVVPVTPRTSSPTELRSNQSQLVDPIANSPTPAMISGYPVALISARGNGHSSESSSVAMRPSRLVAVLD